MWKKYQGGKFYIKKFFFIGHFFFGDVKKVEQIKKVENIRTQGGILSSQFKKYQIQI